MFFGGKRSSKVHISFILGNFGVGIKSLFHERHYLCVGVFEPFFSVFSGGFGKRTRRRATPSSSPKRR